MIEYWIVMLTQLNRIHKMQYRALNGDTDIDAAKLIMSAHVLIDLKVY